MLFLLEILNAVNKKPTCQPTKDEQTKENISKKKKKKKNRVRISLGFIYFILKAESLPHPVEGVDH